MNNLKSIFKFGWPYLRRYKGRLMAGILLGFLFGASNASFIWATKTLFTRLTPPAESTAMPDSKKPREFFLNRQSKSNRQLKQSSIPGCLGLIPS